ESSIIFTCVYRIAFFEWRADAGLARNRRLPLISTYAEVNDASFLQANRSTNRPSRRRDSHGAALFGIFASLGRRACIAQFSKALRGAVHGERHQPRSLAGQRHRGRNGTEPDAGTAGAGEGETECHLWPFQQAGHGSRNSSRADREYPFGGGAAPRGGPQGGRQHGPGARLPAWRRDSAAKPRSRLRTADHRLPRDEFLDGLQFAHLVARRQLPRPDGSLSLVGL